MDHRTPVALPTLLALVLGGVAIFQARPLLQSTRPAPAVPVRSHVHGATGALQWVPARLWEDPLQAVSEYTQELARQQARGDKLEDPAEVVAELRESTSASRLQVLAVHIPGGHYADDVENRLRSRQAVHAALGVAGYLPADSRHIGYVRLSPYTGAGSAKDREAKKLYNREGTHALPYEVFRQYGTGADAPAAGQPASPWPAPLPLVLILWLDERLLGNFPLRDEGLLLDPWIGSLRKAGFSSRLCVVGPTNSGALISMLREAYAPLTRDPESKRWEETLAGACFYSPWATISENARDMPRRGETHVQGIYQWAEPDRPDVCGATPVSELTDEQLGPCKDLRNGGKEEPGAAGSTFDLAPGVMLERTIGTDEQLVDVLIDELALRDADCRKDGYPMALFVESDTAYGQSMARLFEDRVLAAHTGRDTQANVDVYYYSRGMDGITAADKGVQDARRAPGRAPPARAESTRIRGHPSSGKPRIDYIERFVRSIGTFDKEYRSVGVLGADVYDKLLLLRALRDSFPRAMFFTTDLDARLLDPAEYEATHNLIVASHYGLELDGGFQRGLMAFRGSYQTAMYLSALRALRWERAGARDLFRHNRAPLVFEIGRHGAYELGLAGPTCLHPRSPRWKLSTSVGERGVPWLLLILLAGLLGILVWQVVRTQQGGPEAVASRRWLLWPTTVGLVVVAGVAAYDAFRRPDGEPLAMFEGISVWPTTILRVGLISLAVYYMIHMYRSVRESNDAISRRFFDVALPGPSVAPPLWRILASILRAVVVFPFRAAAWIAARIGQLSRRLGDLSGVAKDVRAWAGDLARAYHAVLWWPQRTVPRAAAVWAECVARGKKRLVFVRIFVVVVIFGLFGVTLMKMTGEHRPPVRGDLARASYVLVLIPTVLAINLLMVYMCDTTAVALALMRNLSEKRLAWTPSRVKQVSRMKRVTKGMAREWLAVDLIGRRTAVIEKFVFYPFVVMFIMVVIRHGIFDNFSSPVGLVVVQIAFLGAVVLMAVLLSRAAEGVRARALGRVREELRTKFGRSDGAPARDEPWCFAPPAGTPAGRQPCPREAVDDLITEIEKYKRGAFVPIWKGPVVGALLIPAGGYGSLALIQTMLARV